MTGADEKPARPDKRGGAEGRADRLAAALKANLHRRKAQARGRKAQGDPSQPLASGPRLPHDQDGGAD